MVDQFNVDATVHWHCRRFNYIAVWNLGTRLVSLLFIGHGFAEISNRRLRMRGNLVQFEQNNSIMLIIVCRYFIKVGQLVRIEGSEGEWALKGYLNEKVGKGWEREGSEANFVDSF